MILVQDNFFTEETFKEIQKYCNDNEFQIVTKGEKEFSVLKTPENLIPLLKIDGHEMIFSFIRQAHKDFDTEPRIHCDHIIQGKRTSLARVFYISDKDEVSDNGTAFFINNKWGLKAPEDLTDQEFDRLILEDANDLSKWKENSLVGAVPNRMITYNSSYWHSKFPPQIERGRRIVLVAFYSKV